jgi:hypothetical protein
MDAGQYLHYPENGPSMWAASICAAGQNWTSEPRHVSSFPGPQPRIKPAFRHGQAMVAGHAIRAGFGFRLNLKVRICQRKSAQHVTGY